MSISLGGLFGGSKGDTKTTANSTQTTDSSQRQVTSSQSGQAVQGAGNSVVVNDSSLVALGLKNNDTAASIISHINDTFAAELGKIADTVKQTSNDTLQSAISNGAALSSVADAATQGINTQAAIAGANKGGFLSNLSEKSQTYLAIGAALLGAYYFLKPKGGKIF